MEQRQSLSGAQNHLCCEIRFKDWARESRIMEWIIYIPGDDKKRYSESETYAEHGEHVSHAKPEKEKKTTFLSSNPPIFLCSFFCGCFFLSCAVLES